MRLRSTLGLGAAAPQPGTGEEGTDQGQHEHGPQAIEEREQYQGADQQDGEIAWLVAQSQTHPRGKA